MQNFLQILLTFEETLSPADRAKAAARPLTEAVAGEPWPTAAIPMENPYCSCELTRVRPRCSRLQPSWLRQGGFVPVSFFSLKHRLSVAVRCLFTAFQHLQDVVVGMENIEVV